MVLDAALTVTRTTLYFICFPFILTLRFLWTALVIVTAPIVHVADYLLHAIAWPVRQLAKLETLYIYFGVAVLVGILLGAIIHHTTRFLINVLGIDKASEERGRTLAAYKAKKTERQAKKAKQSLPQIGLKPMRLDGAIKDEYAEWLKRDKSPGTKGPLFTTILEEEDSSEAGF
ncbi:hypothetical protein MMC30_004417 [Trapelia coarctata]|nr:hypothetical protein [Trapelia coarctata]